MSAFSFNWASCSYLAGLSLHPVAVRGAGQGQLPRRYRWCLSACAQGTAWSCYSEDSDKKGGKGRRVESVEGGGRAKRQGSPPEAPAPHLSTCRPLPPQLKGCQGRSASSSLGAGLCVPTYPGQDPPTADSAGPTDPACRQSSEPQKPQPSALALAADTRALVMLAPFYLGHQCVPGPSWAESSSGEGGPGLSSPPLPKPRPPLCLPNQER